jgi:hypothetical protein
VAVVILEANDEVEKEEEEPTTLNGAERPANLLAGFADADIVATGATNGAVVGAAVVGVQFARLAIGFVD